MQIFIDKKLCINYYYFFIGIEQSYIEWGDTIRSPQFLKKNSNSIMKFNKVIANPPFSKKKWGYENIQNDTYNRFHRGMPPRSKGDWAFISHMIESLLPEGTAGVVVPHGVLFRGGAEGRIREKLIKENMIHAVIGLPSNLFFGTRVNCCAKKIKGFEFDKFKNKTEE